jgi:hypothetical protein
MNIKERIIRAKMARLDPSKHSALIARLSAELPRPPQAVTPRELPPAKSNIAPESSRPSPLTEADVEKFRSLKSEVLIRSAAFGDIWLVPERTGAGRFELLPEDVRALGQAREMFDAKIVEVTKYVPV